MILYKDKPEVKHRNKDDYQKVLQEIASFLNKYESDKSFLKKKMLRGIIEEKKRHESNHDNCGRNNTDSNRITEKRICRCMFYYNDDEKKCNKCTQNSRWKNVGKIKINNYEFPTKHVIPGVGGMDLILDDKYACEVKPQASEESLTRMFAEILTYTQDCDQNYKPAICIFPGSKQMKDYKKYKSNPDFITISKFIKIFFFNIISEKDRIIEFEIKPIALYTETT